MAEAGEGKSCRGNGVMSWSCQSSGVGRRDRGGEGGIRRQTKVKKKHFRQKTAGTQQFLVT